MKTRFNDPELFDSFMEIIEKSYKEAYEDLDSNLRSTSNYKRALTKAFHSLKKTLKPHSNFNPACFQTSSVLDYNFKINVKKLDDNQIPTEVKSTIKSLENRLENEIGKSEITKIPEVKDKDELVVEIMRYKEICRIADEKLENLRQILDENRVSDKVESNNKDDSVYVDIFSAIVY